MKINFHLLKLLQNNLKNRFSPNAKETLDANSDPDEDVFYDDEEYENLNDASAGDIDAFGRIFHRIGDYLSNPTAKDETPLPQAPTRPPVQVERIPKAPTRPLSPPTKRGKVRIRLPKTP